MKKEKEESNLQKALKSMGCETFDGVSWVYRKGRGFEGVVNQARQLAEIEGVQIEVSKPHRIIIGGN